MKINITFKKMVMIHLILILIIIGLIIKIRLQEKEYNCDKCIISFQKFSSLDKRSKYVIEVPMNRLYVGYMEDRCPVQIDLSGSYSFTEFFEIKEVKR